ncbi:hypothetical protein [Haloarcula pellucida]|nr:hypothetical protein [Halomicroarcula pellucida]MBX0347106.1 hypothetical protein [Halomicroarcula pellucida]
MPDRFGVGGPAVVTGASRGIGRPVAASLVTGQTPTPRGVPPTEETPDR